MDVLFLGRFLFPSILRVIFHVDKAVSPVLKLLAVCLDVFIARSHAVYTGKNRPVTARAVSHDVERHLLFLAGLRYRLRDKSLLQGIVLFLAVPSTVHKVCKLLLLALWNEAVARLVHCLNDIVPLLLAFLRRKVALQRTGGKTQGLRVLPVRTFSVTVHGYGNVRYAVLGIYHHSSDEVVEFRIRAQTVL